MRNARVLQFVPAFRAKSKRQYCGMAFCDAGNDVYSNGWRGVSRKWRMCIKVGQGEGCNLWMTRRHLQMTVRASFQSSLPIGRERGRRPESPHLPAGIFSPMGRRHLRQARHSVSPLGEGRVRGLRLVQTGRPDSQRHLNSLPVITPEKPIALTLHLWENPRVPQFRPERPQLWQGVSGLDAASACG
ncbi:hypothetical protein FHT78_000091 [Rhizobium sp. BK196]|nr:hypothetical protein [Rhizobium sp. BK196]